jgi:tetratricopeptide (TPR) repeat protein
MSNILAILMFLGQLPGGDAFFEKSDYANAAAAYENVPALERTAPLINRLAISYHFLNRLKEAEAAYKDAIKRNAQSAEALNNLGALHYSRKNFGEAERQFRQALEVDPENSTARHNLRATRYARENGRKAREAALVAEKEKALLIQERSLDSLLVHLLLPAKDIEQASLHEKRGDSFMARKMYDDAVIEYRKSIVIDKYNASVVNRLGVAYLQSQKLKDAEMNYREALKLNPYYIEALNNLGAVEFMKKNYDRALNQYFKALKSRPESSIILRNIGACLFAMERYEEGLEVYKKALRIDPQLFEHAGGFGSIIQTTTRNDGMQNFYLAKMFAGVGDIDRAISLLYKAVEGGFKDAKLLKTEPAFSGLQNDERFLKLLESMAANQPAAK